MNVDSAEHLATLLARVSVKGKERKSIYIAPFAPR